MIKAMHYWILASFLFGVYYHWDIFINIAVGGIIGIGCGEWSIWKQEHKQAVMKLEFENQNQEKIDARIFAVRGFKKPQSKDV